MRAVSLLLALAIYSTPASSALEKRDVGDMCYLLSPNTAVIDDRLYFMSANYTFVASTGQNTTLMPYLYWVPLDNSFPAQENIPSSDLNMVSLNSSVPGAYEQAMNSDGGYGNRMGAFFTTNCTIYVFAGTSSKEENNVLAAYNLTTSTWSNVRVSGGDFNYGSRTGGASVSVAESGMSFYLGGDNPHTPGLLRFNASNPNSVAWTNETLGNGSYGTSVPDLARHNMVYIPAGIEGVLIAFGGSNFSAPETEYYQSGLPNDSDMSVITVYDIHTHTWYTVTASGTVPSSRIQTCAVVTTAPDDTAFHITMYGGYSLLAGRSYEDVYVLSIPSFTWINIPDQSSNTESGLSSGVGRDSMSCDLVYGSQMTVLGGSIRDGADPISPAGQCNSTFPPVRVLDLTTYTWVRELDEGLVYEVPAVIYDVIGGNSSGGNSNQVPSGGFESAALASIFQHRVSQPATTTSSTTPLKTSQPPTSTTSNNPTSAKSPAHTNTAAIAGAVTGAVVALLTATALLTYFYRKKRYPTPTAGSQAINRDQGPYLQPMAQECKTTYTDIYAAAPAELHSSHRPWELDDRVQIYELSSSTPSSAKKVEKGARCGGVKGRVDLVGELP